METPRGVIAANRSGASKISPRRSGEASARRRQKHRVELLSGDPVQVALADLGKTEVVLSGPLDVHTLCLEVKRPGPRELLKAGSHV